ncbi:MAG: prolyl oligopeptidase family serine peptidase [Gemmatimonadota bacterium]|nr:prolyl oligopeptidase family serine peptidase [Gemmatimonadota bacterium]
MTPLPTPRPPRGPLFALAAASALALPALLPPAPASAQDRPLVTPDDYGRWESLGFPTLSSDGTWLAYTVSRVDRKSELRLRQLDGDSTQVYEWGGSPRFSPDGRWFMWTAGVSPEERERLAQAEQPVPGKTMLMDLASGETREFEGVSSASFDRSGRFLALRGSPPREPRGKGADLRVLTLADGAVATFGNVTTTAWSPVAPLLALVIGTGSDLGNGVQIYDAEAGTLRSADASGSRYQSLRWRDDSADLLVMRTREVASADETAYDVLVWRGVDRGGAPMVLDGDVAGIPDTLDIGGRGPAWSEDGTMISFGLRVVEEEEEEGEGEEEGEEAAGEEGEAEEEEGEGEEGAGDEEDAGAPEPPEEEPDLPGVQIWHTKDIDLFPAQSRFGGNANRTLLAIWRLNEDRVSVVGSDLETSSRLLRGWETALEETDEPYPWGAMFGRPYADTWAVDTRTGERRRILTRVRHSWPSTGGGWMVRWDGSAYHSLNLRTGEEYDLTSAVNAEFANVDYDTPTDVTPPTGFGPAGWLEDDAALLLYDKHDIWRVEPDGSNPTRLTRGAETGITYRMTGLIPDDDDDEPGIDPRSRPYLSLYNEKTEERGYARFDRGWAGAETLILEHASVGGLIRADSADVMLYRVSAFDDPPDYFVAGPDLADPVQVTEINPFITEVAWGRAELVDFVSETGRDLQFVLLYPANHEAGTAVPTIVYTYEILSPSMHSFRVPRETDYYNYTAWTQHGYAVLLPDIVYQAREPGVSALASVRAAVAKAVEMGVTDPDAVGLIGHSWGGYQATYLPTRTDIFAASVAGAPITNFVSFMGALHWGPGIAEVDHWETGQARMEVPFWEDPEAHRRNSPIHEVHNMETPLLMAFGDDDGVVDFDQGTEFFNFARRAGRQMVLLVYEGEDHGLAQEANQKDYHRRILEWFGHYLKGEPAPRWITDGVAFEELEEEKKRVATGKR